MYVFFIFFVCLATNIIGGFTDRIYQRLILGRDMLAEVQKVCVQKGDTKPLYARLLAEPVPLYVKIVDALLSESRQARLATLYRSTGEQLHEVLHGLIAFRPGGFAVWEDADVQQHLQMVYGNDNHTSFNEIMRKLKSLHSRVTTPHWWRLSLEHRTLKDLEEDLDAILTKSLENLLSLRLLINNLDSQVTQSPFPLFLPRLLHAIEVLNINSKLLESIDISSIKRRYYAWRTRVLENAIKGCTPPLMPMAQKP